MLWLVGAALAASPGGIRVGPGVPTHMVGVREVVVTHPGQDFAISQTTVRAQYGDAPYGLDFELPIVASWGGRWHDEGLGQFRVGGRLWLGAHHAPVSLGLEVAGPFPRSTQTQVWGSLARDTLSGWEMLLVAEGTVLPDAPITIRGGAGFRQGPEFGALWFPLPILECAVAWVQPIAGPLSAGGEFEVLVDLTPVTLRPFVRVDLPAAVSLDLAVQMPLVAIVEGTRTLQVAGQVRKFF